MTPPRSFLPESKTVTVVSVIIALVLLSGGSFALAQFVNRPAEPMCPADKAEVVNGDRTDCIAPITDTNPSVTVQQTASAPTANIPDTANTKLHVLDFSADPDQNLIHIQAQLTGVPAGYNKLYVMFPSHEAPDEYYTIDAPPIDMTSLSADGMISLNWPSVPIEGGTNVVFVLATDSAQLLIGQSGNDASGNLYVGKLVEGTYPVPADSRMPVFPSPNSTVLHR